MTKWQPDAGQLRRPVYISLADQFTAAIKSGRLVHEEKLPGHRDLAYDLKVSIQTVSKAYDVLARRGLVSGEVGRGTYVTSTGPSLQSPYIAERLANVIDLSIVTPVCTSFHLDRMKDALHRLADTLPPAAVLSFRPNTIFPRHNEAAVAWLSTLGVSTSPQNLFVTNGASSAFTIALMSAAGPGTVLAAEEICYHVIRPLSDYLGMRVRAIAADGDGMLPEALEEACLRDKVRVLVLQPNLANPTATLMPDARRLALAEMARKHDLTIIENDVFGPLISNRPRPIAALAPERTIYFTGFTKVAVPGLRIGYIAAPDHFAATIANRQLMANWMATPMIAELATLWLGDGTIGKLVDWQRDALRARHRIVTDALHGAHYRAHPEALHVWLTLPPDHDELAFVSQARVRGVAVAPSTPFSLSGSPVGAVRVSVGATEADELRTGLDILASLLRAAPDRSVLTI
ncbi:MAG TPA: PLP-dependent aminotransferase family protein [Shinella sp.]|jgi:DNA-binding transcriptional MocR family regulator|uniref:MocR-like ectoine utilization transcription factor EhuR n=1 Tax=Shinella sp. TaxID=1870904 RepID=UPI002E0F3F43|nr:PLP-dependent aminotransferase family protein [Shinella sp.]